MQSDHTPDHLLDPTSGPISAGVSGRPGSRNLIYFSWACLVYVIFVIVWGAFVRASGSGAGCGSHWPLCNGQILPSTASVTGAAPAAVSVATWIEFSHRITSGLSLLMVASLFFLVRRGSRLATSAKLRSEQRRAAGWAFGFIVGEAGVGAVLVLQRLVAGDSSLARAVVIALHLANTLFLVAALVWTAMALGVPEAAQSGSGLSSGLSGPGPDGRPLAAALFKRLRRVAALFLVVGASGAIVALGDTLFPAKDLISGMAQDLSASAHFLVRLRVVHPILAVGTAWALWLVLGAIESSNKNNDLVSKVGFYARFFLVAQVMLGILNWLLMAPHWLQLVHLAGSNALWVSVVALLFALNRIAKATPVG
ncbi:MAG: heme A synthase [Acidobacteriia bacterium]|nr:heme A synthase [Terriglobia bacterium]